MDHEINNDTIFSFEFDELIFNTAGVTKSTVLLHTCRANHIFTGVKVRTELVNSDLMR